MNISLPRTLLWFLCIWLWVGLASTRAAAPPPQTDGDIPPGKPAAWDIVESQAPGGPAAPGDGRMPAGTVASPNACLGAPTRQIRYTSDGVIHLEGCGQAFTLSQVAASPAVGPARLELVDPASKIWLLKVKLKVEEGATLRLIGGAAGDVNWLRLRSDASSGIWLRAENGNLFLRDTKVTSWDTARNSVDTDASVAPDGTGGRSYIASRSVLTKGRPTTPPTTCGVDGGTQEPYEARMDIVNSQISYLGYNASESYGVTWKVYYKVNPADPGDQPPPGRQLYAMVDIFGDVSGSTFDHNYFGSYTFGAYCMSWRANTFAENIQYGLDPHDDSDYLTIDDNTFRDNGNHGLICSVECDNLVITNNRSYGNGTPAGGGTAEPKGNGIMLHRNVNGALVEGNTVYNNFQDGIAIFDSHGAVVRNNTVVNNATSAIRLSVGSSGSLIEGNVLGSSAAAPSGAGYLIYTYKGNDAPTSGGDGLPKNNTFRNNRLAGYKSPMMKIVDATANLFEGSIVDGPASSVDFRSAVGNRLRDGQVGKAIQITLDVTSTVMLEDSRGYVWMASSGGPRSVAAPGGTTLALTHANTGGSVSMTTLDLAVRPAQGSIAIQPATWRPDSKSWIESPSATVGTVTHIVGDLQAGTCYRLSANGAAIRRLTADTSGRISFAYSGYSGPVRFAVEPASGCGAAAPAYQLFLPLLRRS
jgi:parallel beta-helix repeat protein